MLRMLIYQGREINTDTDIYKILSKRMTPQKDVLFGGAGSDDIKGGAGDDLILGDAQYSVASRAARNGLPLHPGRGHQLHAAAARSRR